MHPESQAFHDKLASDKIAGREAAKEYIKQHGIEAAKERTNARNLTNEQAKAEYGFWVGYIAALLSYRGD